MEGPNAQPCAWRSRAVWFPPCDGRGRQGWWLSAPRGHLDLHGRRYLPGPGRQHEDAEAVQAPRAWGSGFQVLDAGHNQFGKSRTFTSNAGRSRMQQMEELEDVIPLKLCETSTVMVQMRFTKVKAAKT